MIRFIVTLSKEDKAWLEQTSKSTGISQSRLIRNAIFEYRHEYNKIKFLDEIELAIEKRSSIDG